MKTIAECIYGRRTIRNFSENRIEDEVLTEILKAAIYAPSACNFQAWKIIVISSNETKNKLLESYKEKATGWIPRMIIENSHLLVMTYRNDIGVSGRRYYDYIQSGAAAIENMLLMAYEYDIGGCWICHLPDINTLRKVLNIPDNYDVIAFVALGYPKENALSDENAEIYHYGSTEAYRLHERKYTLNQFVSSEKFVAVEGDSTEKDYPKV